MGVRVVDSSESTQITSTMSRLQHSMVRLTCFVYLNHFLTQLLAVCPVKKFIENGIDQPFIDHDDFYQRYTFEYKARVIDVSLPHPKLYQILTPPLHTSPNLAPTPASATTPTRPTTPHAPH